MEMAIVVVGFLGFVAFRHWLRHQRRVLVHRERMAALEKGIELPPIKEEQPTGNGVRRLFLFGGLVWIFLGIGAAVVLGALSEATLPPDWPKIPREMVAVGIIPFGIGLAHLIAYFAEKREGRRPH